MSEERLFSQLVHELGDVGGAPHHLDQLAPALGVCLACLKGKVGLHVVGVCTGRQEVDLPLAGQDHGSRGARVAVEFDDLFPCSSTAHLRGLRDPEHCGRVALLFLVR